MAVLTVILGVLVFLGGVACLWVPEATGFLFESIYVYIFLVLFFVSGIVLLIRCIAAKRFGIDFFFAILTLLVGGFVLSLLFGTPYASLITVQIMLWITAIWLIVWGIVSFVNVIRTRKLVGGGMFAFGLIVSILLILFGCYSCFHLQVIAGLLGVLISIAIMFAGIDLIMLGCTREKQKK